MNPLEFLNQNPWLMSLIAFPFGVLLLVGVGKIMGMGRVYREVVDALKAHTVAEIKIETRLAESVEKLGNLIAAHWDDRRFIDGQIDYFKERFSHVDTQLQVIIGLLPKRKADEKHESS